MPVAHGCAIENERMVSVPSSYGYKPSKVLPGTEERVDEASTRLEFPDFFRTCVAENLKIRTDLERHSPRVYSGYKTYALHCFHGHRLNADKNIIILAATDKIKNDARL